jgi:hypothetical protein
LACAEGDGFVNGTKSGTLIPNPAGVSSPLFATILKFTFYADVDRLTAGFTLTLADHFTLLDGATVTLDNGAGAHASIELLSQFRWAVSDPVTIFRNSHPYGLAFLPSQPDSLYVADSGQNTLVQVSLSTGKAKLVTRFPKVPSPTPAAIVSEAVPTSVRVHGDHLLVTLLSGGPFVSGRWKWILSRARPVSLLPCWLPASTSSNGLKQTSRRSSWCWNTAWRFLKVNRGD